LELQFATQKKLSQTLDPPLNLGFDESINSPEVTQAEMLILKLDFDSI
jgi:hypothetical protein